MEVTFDRNEFLLTLKLLARDPLSVIGGIIVLLFIGTSISVVIFGNTMAPYDPNGINLSDASLPPSLQHLMGTDNLGRDILSRCIVASPIDAEIALFIVGGSTLIGLPMGSVAGYFGGRLDEVLMRITDLFAAFPNLVLAVAIGVALGPGVEHVIEANLVAWWPVYTRLARAGAKSLKESQFVEAARVAGLSQFSIIWKHLIPNNVPPIIVFATLNTGSAILYASVLSYLGLGAQPPQAEWGKMVYDGQIYLSQYWWMSIMPGLVILFTALGFNLLGDAARDALDPRYRT
jgi:peptide/nickel transport system permease protein